MAETGVIDKADEATETEADELNVPERNPSTDDFQEEDSVGIYLRQIGQIPLLKPEEEARLFQEISTARTANQASVDTEQVNQARLRVVEGNLRLAANIAKRYRNLGLPFLDLVQEGNMGLMKAVDKFKPEKGYRFTTYATWWIQQGIMRALTDQGRTIRLPAHIVERIGKLGRSKEHLQQKINRQPSIGEIAEAMSLPIEKVRQALESAKGLASLDMLLDDEKGKRRFMDLIEDVTASSPEDEAAQSELREKLEEVMGDLSERERTVLELRFGLGGNGNLDGNREWTLEEIATVFNVTRERVRQIEEKALFKLKHPVRVWKLKKFRKGV